MSEQLMVRSEITINATADKVWDALTNPEQTKKYMFGCETVSDWKPGSELLWRMDFEGKEFIAVKGTIVSIDAPNKLAYTTIDPNGTIADIPENYLTVTYTLTEQNGHTTLVVTQGDYATVADGERRYNEAFNGGEGWSPILVQIKALLEG